MSQPSPLDVVFGAADRGRAVPSRWLRGAAWLLALLLHALLVWVALRSGPSLEAWSAELALEVHEALVDDQVIELATPPPPAAPEVETPAPRVAPTRSAPLAATAVTPTPAPSEPTAASAVVTQDAPLDLTGETIVTGSAAVAVGGAASAQGQGETPTLVTEPVAPAPIPPSPARASVALSRPVSLDAARWQCAWPAEAMTQEIYEQAVVLRVVVAADGRVEAAQLIDDPGMGFGRAALACAKRTTFTPALDAEGNAVRALSPPIRVRFTR